MMRRCSIITAYTVPEGAEHEQLEPPSRKQEDARRPNVPKCPDH